MKVSDLMAHHTEICFPQDSLATAAGKMWDRDIGALAVVNPARQVVAMITDRDVCMAAYMQAKPLPEIPVSVAMSKDLVYTTAESDLADAERLMRMHGIRRLPVLDVDGLLVGMLSLHDLLEEAEKEMSLVEKEVTPQEIVDTFAAVCAPRRQGALPH